MRFKELCGKLELTSAEMLDSYYNTTNETFEAWLSGREVPPPVVIQILENTIKNAIPRTKEEVMSLPFTVVELKSMCDDMIRKGYGLKSVLLSNDTAETGFHGMYYGFGDEEESDTYIKLN